MSNVITRFYPDSFPLYPGLSKGPDGWISAKTTEEDVAKALTEERLEDAKFHIYDVYGRRPSELQLQLIRIIKKIVELNKTTLSPQHAALNYTLDAAYSLGCHIYTLAVNDKFVSPFGSDHDRYGRAILALRIVADAYGEKGDAHHVAHTLNRLQPAFTEKAVQGMIESTLARHNLASK